MAIKAVSLISSAPAIEFASSPIGVARNGVGEADCLITPADSIANHVEIIVINGETQTIEPFIAGALAKAIRASHELQSQNLRVDCSAFAVMLCGGFYQGVTRYDYDQSAKTIDYRKPGINARHLTLARIMEPLQLAEPFMLKGRVKVFWPRHTVVPVSKGINLYAHKFGEGPIALTDIETATKHYGTSLLATVLRMEFADQTGNPILAYHVPGSAGVAAEEAYRFNSQ
jgi:hypothetical protein